MSKDTKNKTNDETPTKITDKSRRNFLKFGILGAGAAAIAATGADAPNHMGKIMGFIMKDHKGEVDPGLVKRLAMEALQGS